MEFSAQMYEFDAKPFIEVYCKVVSKQLSLNFIVYRIYSRVGHTFLPQNWAKNLGATYTLDVNTNTSPLVKGCP